MASIFTKIIDKEIPADIILENKNLIVIKDINPRAKTHLLIIPKKEIRTINHLEDSDKDLLFEMFKTAKSIAKDMGIQDGYKLLFNVGENGGQEVMHIHLHLMSDI